MSNTSLRLAALASLAATALLAAEKTNTTTQLPEVVVTATRSEQPIAQTAASVTVITREEINTRQINTLADALEGVPSLSIVRNGTPGQLTSVFLRGTESNHTLLTVDGRRVPANLAGGFDYANLALDNVERIEVVRTSSSSLYGADAIGGVINVITKSGRGLAKPEHEVSFEGGSFNTFREMAASRGAFGKFDYAVSGSQLNADFPRDNNGYRLTNLRSSLGYELSDAFYLDLKSSFYESDGGAPGFNGPFASITDRLKRQVANVSPGLVWSPRDEFESKFYYTYDRQYQKFQTAPFDQPLGITGHQVDWQNNYRPFETWKLTAGLTFQDTDIDGTVTTFPAPFFTATQTPLQNHLTGAGGYLQSQWSPVERASVINSIRFDHYSDYRDAVTWRQGLSFRLPVTETLLHGSVSRSFAPPSPQDLYFPGANNPNLRAEVALSWEAGVEQEFLDKKLSASAVWFQHNYDDFIELDGTFTPQNIPQATAEGVELGLKYAPCDAFTTRLSYTYLTATDDLNLRRLIRRPRHQLNADLTLKPARKVTLTSGLSWQVDRQDANFPPPLFARTNIPSEDILLLHAALSYQVNDHLQVWVRGENLTDDKFEYVRGFPALRLAAYGGLKLTF